MGPTLGITFPIPDNYSSKNHQKDIVLALMTSVHSTNDTKQDTGSEFSALHYERSALSKLLIWE